VSGVVLVEVVGQVEERGVGLIGVHGKLRNERISVP